MAESGYDVLGHFSDFTEMTPIKNCYQIMNF